ncbi:uncharacterized protein [Rutidosis leptorrhynchoides]|uniref:uncharacterized protein n=1 Tax=Rutidosis leptorrhynchoides TaxID=125765 RepID=UPI003A98E865
MLEVSRVDILVLLGICTKGRSLAFEGPVGNTEVFPIEVGLHQGSALNPFLFSLILDELSRGIQECIPWCLIFADDIVLVSESKEELNRRLEQWRVALEDQILHPQNSFRYLGSMLHKSGRIDEDVSHRIEVWWVKWRAVIGVLFDRKIPLKLEGKFYKVAFRPAMLYGSEENLEVRNIIDKLREEWLRWFGHVRRRPLTAPVRRVEALTVDGVRRRGRPTRKWEDRIKLDLKQGMKDASY